MSNMVEPIPPKQPPVSLEPAGEGASEGPSGSMQESSVGIEAPGFSSGDECTVGLSREQLENSAGPKDSALDVHGEGQDIKKKSCNSKPQSGSQQGHSLSSTIVDCHTKFEKEAIIVEQAGVNNEKESKKQEMKRGVVSRSPQCTSLRSSNRWNTFQKQHKKLGLSVKGLSALYKQSMSGSYRADNRTLEAMRSGSDSVAVPWSEEFSNESGNFSQKSPNKGSKRSGRKESQPPSSENVVTPEKCIKHETSSIEEMPQKATTETNSSENKISALVGAAVEETVARAEESTVKSKPVSAQEEAPNKHVEDVAESKSEVSLVATQRVLDGFSKSTMQAAFEEIAQTDSTSLIAIFSSEPENAGCSSSSNQEKVTTGVDENYTDKEQLKITGRLIYEIHKRKKSSRKQDLNKVNEEAKQRARIKASLQSSSSSTQPNSDLLNLSLEFRSSNLRLRRQPRENLPNTHDRLFKNFSDWLIVDPQKVCAVVPEEQGVYEWGCKAQSGKKIVCFYLGKSSCLKKRIGKYVDKRKNQITGPKSDNNAKQQFFQELMRQGFSLYIRFWITSPQPSELVESWLLVQVDYGLNSTLNGGRRGVKLEDGSQFPPRYESLLPIPCL